MDFLSSLNSQWEVERKRAKAVAIVVAKIVIKSVNSFIASYKYKGTNLWKDFLKTQLYLLWL